MYGICQLVLGMLPRKTGTSGKFGVQGQQQVLSDYNMSIVFSFFFRPIILVQLMFLCYLCILQPSQIMAPLLLDAIQ